MQENNLNNGPEVVISSAEPSAMPSKPARKRRKKAPARRAVAAPTLPKEESSSNSNVWFMAISNLALLLAIFTIIFAAHHAFQKNRTAKVAAVGTTSQATETAVEVKTEEAVPTTAQEATEAVQQAANIETEDTAKIEGTTAVVKTEKTSKKKLRKVRGNEDPYTNGGPLDLDRRSVADVNDVKKAFSDHSNPWNGGGALDLDSPASREQYNKKSYLSSTESDK